MSEKISLRNPVTVNVILSFVALCAFAAGGIWFVVLMPWPDFMKAIFGVTVVIIAAIIIKMAYVKNRDLTGDITIDLEKKTFTLNGIDYDSFSRLNSLTSKVFTSTRIPQASGFSATFLTLGVDKNTMLLNSMDAAKGLTLPQLEGLHKLVLESSLNEEQKLLFESFVETVKVIKNIQN